MQNNHNVTSRMIKKIINYNYIVLKAFDVADGNMTVNEYMKHVVQRTKDSKGEGKN